jgi:asparagine synthase (glutamine-hydrolysing)
MTMLAGIFSRGDEHPIEAAVRERLQHLISRSPDDKAVVFRDARCFLAKIDIGAYGEPAFHRDVSGSVSLLAGEPLLEVNGAADFGTRTQDLELLNQSWDRGDWNLLTRTRGIFCAVHYQPQLERLHLISDKLGERPLYYWANDHYIIFSSALRVLEGLAEVPKEMDLRAVTEISAFGFPLGDRTPYSNIIRLKAGEVVQVSDNSVTRSQYWRWDDIQPSAASEEELVRDAYETFTEAVTLRLRKDTTTLAFLSGGLDSRCIVTALRGVGAKVHTFNFAPDGSQDKIFAAEFARRVGTFHYENAGLYNANLDLNIGAPLPMALAEVARGPNHLRSDRPERPQLVWSGDGGSVGLGHVYLSRAMVEPLRAGRRDEAIRIYLKQQGAFVLTKLLKSDKGGLRNTVPHQGVCEELEDIHCKDPVRGFHLFLMLNDQRRHLSHWYEHIDLHRFEFQEPFYDSVFLEKVLAIPVDLCLEHKFYTKWFSRFPPVARSVPWQTYPGHEPCSLPVPKELGYQWGASGAYDAGDPLKTQLLRLADEMLRANWFPDELLSKSYLRLVSWIYRVGLRNYGYAIKVAGAYYKYWVICAGRYDAGTGSSPGN